jgi:hypothetical protein
MPKIVPGILGRVPLKRSIDTAERRSRLGARHRLAAEFRAETPLEVARSIVALHATDPATVFLSAAARMLSPSIQAVERALYDDRVLVRMLGMRRTMFVVPDELAPVVQAACTRALSTQLRKRYAQILLEAGVVDGDARSFMERVESDTLAALERRREATAQELGRDVPDLKTQVTLAPGKPYEGTQGIATWILILLSVDGKVVRGRPRGSWISSQYRWAPLEAWLPNGMPYLSTAEAQSRLIEAWLRAFGPGTYQDLKWWTGLTVREVREALSRLQVVEVDLGEASGVLLSDDLETVPAPDPWASFLPALDPTPMAYAGRDWFLGPHQPELFDRSGNIGPTVWSDGRVVGGWAQRRDGSVAYRLLEDVGADAKREIQSAAQRLEGFLGQVRVTPRFRTPLERELSA